MHRCAVISHLHAAAPLWLALFAAAPALAGADPFADSMLGYVPGSSPLPASGYTNPLTALGSPERFTGELSSPSVVSPFSPPFATNEIVSLGGGGSLTLGFDEPITDHPGNPFGLDLIIFGNAGCIDTAFPGGPAGGMFGADGGIVEVSVDGTTWHAIPGSIADNPFPTLGYLDAGAYDDTPGRVPSDFTRPLDPSITPADYVGLTHDEIVEFYDGSGGGMGLDLASVSLTSVSFVRIRNLAGSGANIEIDAVSDVSPAFASADLNQDSFVNGVDLGILLSQWNSNGVADLNDDRVVNGIDLGILLAAWTF